MIIEKKIDASDTPELANSVSTTEMNVGGDIWYVYFSSKGYFILIPWYGKVIYYCQSRRDVVELLKKFYVFIGDPELAIYEKLDRLVRW